MEFCDSCGGMMKKVDDEWVCSSCDPDKTTQSIRREYGRDAVLLQCPRCNKRRPYCGAEDAPLGIPRLHMGIDRHLKTHGVNENRRRELAQEVIKNRDNVTVRSELCEEADNRGWDYYTEL